ncbi:MAG: hypothetical protein F6K37_22805 [Moorea sp. SIO4E2]|nr:hypothetical protein [Moorena sp. SIO4E2]
MARAVENYQAGNIKGANAFAFGVAYGQSHKRCCRSSAFNGEEKTIIYLIYDEAHGVVADDRKSEHKTDQKM